MATKLKRLVLKELSLVDRPANIDSVVSIFKSRGIQAVEDITKFCCGDDYKGAKAFADVLTDMEARKKYWEAQEELYPLMDALSESIRSVVADPAMTVAGKESTIRVDIEEFMMKLRDKLPDAQEALTKFAKDVIGGITSNEGKSMSTEKTELEKAQEALAVEKTAREQAEILAKMCDEEKEFMKEMDEDKKKEFMGMKPEDRKEKMRVSKAADETITLEGGVVVSKSVVGAAAFAIVKSQQNQLDEQRKDIVKTREEAELAVLTKRAGDELSHLPGTDAEKAAVLKAINGMPEAVAKTLNTILKAADATAAKGFDTIGTTKSAVPGSAAEQIDTLAKAHAAKENCSYAEAYDAVITKNASLYDMALKEGN